MIISIIMFLGFILMYFLLKTTKDIAPKKETFKLVANKNSEALSFIVTYIVPFAVHFISINDWLSFAILFLIIGYLYLDTSLFCINPLLKIFFKYNVYLVEQDNRDFYLLSKKSYFKSGVYTLQIVPLTDSLIVEVKENGN